METELPRNVVKHCAHCGKLSGMADFCCAGCETVYSVLLSSGFAEFYSRRQRGVTVRAPEPARISNQSFHAWDSVAKQECELFVEGVHCSACLWLLERIPSLLPGEVRECRLDLGRSTLRVVLKEGGRISSVAALIASWGYVPRLLSTPSAADQFRVSENRRQLVELGIAGALAGNIMLMSIPLYAGVQGQFLFVFEAVSALLAVPSLFYSGRTLFRNVRTAARTRVFSIDVPIVLALLTAFFWSLASLVQGTHDLYFDSLSALVFLLLGSRYLLARLRQIGLGHARSYSSIGGGTARRVGEIVVLKNPSEFEFDGIVRRGSAWVNQSFLTGESTPVSVQPGDLVYSGAAATVIGEPLEIEVVATGEATRIAKMLAQVRAENTERSRVERVYDAWAKTLLQIVLVVGVGTFTYWVIRGQTSVGIQRSLALLIVTCPCALALAVPLAMSLATRKAFANGLIVRDPDLFERLAKVRKIFFDKTGTLTEGRPDLVDPDWPKELEPVLRALCGRSRHPVAKSILSALPMGVMSDLEDYSEVPGIGVSARVGEKIYALSRPRDHAGDSSGAVLTENGKIVAEFSFNDRLRPDTARVLEAIHSEFRPEFEILSGDRPEAVLRFTRSFGDLKISSRARLLPEEKSKQVKDARANGDIVMMVGDGVNDALALREADVSLAVQGGMETALEVASVYSTREGVGGVLSLLRWGAETRTTLRGCFVFSTAYNALSGFLAVTGRISPLAAAVLMPLSAVTVFIYVVYRQRGRGAQS